MLGSTTKTVKGITMTTMVHIPTLPTIAIFMMPSVLGKATIIMKESTTTLISASLTTFLEISLKVPSDIKENTDTKLRVQ